MIATTAYLDLFLRRITEPSLLFVFLKLICVQRFDDQPILLNLISRISGTSRLSLVTLVLFETMINIACEDVIYELIFKYLMTGSHMAEDRVKQAARIDDVGMFDETSEKLLALSKSLSTHNENLSISSSNDSSILQSPLTHYMEYLNDAHFFVTLFTNRTAKWKSGYNSKCIIEFLTSEARNSPVVTDSPSGSENTCSDSGVFLQINQQQQVQNGKQCKVNGAKNQNNIISNNIENNMNNNCSSSSSHAVQVPEHNESEISSIETDDSSRMIGPLLSILLSKLSSLLHNDVCTNLRITGVIARLASYPQPLIKSFLLSPILVLEDGIMSLHQILAKLVDEVHHKSKTIPDFEIKVAKARSLFIARDDCLSGRCGFIRYVHDHYSDSVHDRRISLEDVPVDAREYKSGN